MDLAMVRIEEALDAAMIGASKAGHDAGTKGMKHR
jgi:hypothetical protein